MLYAGTEQGVAWSADDGATWKQLKLNLPTVAVHDLVVKENDLVLGTHGRSVWILDDLTPVREWSAAIAAKDVHLFPVQPAVRYRYHETVEEGPKSRFGANPPPGAVIQYSLGKKPKGEMELEILNGKGERVVLLTSKKEEEKPEPDAGDD